MSIQLDAKLEAVIRQKVADGLYDEPNEVIRQALEALEERERLQQLRAKQQVGLDQLERGEGRALTPEVWEELKQNAARKAQAGHRPNPDVCP